jgi:translation initiation factor IF-1
MPRSNTQRSKPGGARQGTITLTGLVIQALPGGLFRVELPNGRQILARVAGGLRGGFVRVVASKRVSLEISAFNLEQARITGCSA